MILSVTGISAGIELRFGYRWQLVESNKCGSEIPQKHLNSVGLSGVGPRGPVLTGESMWRVGIQQPHRFLKAARIVIEALGPHGGWYAGCGVYQIEKYDVSKLDELPY